MKKFEGNFLRAVTPDCDYGIDAQLARVGNNLIGNIAHNFFPVLDRAVAEGIAQFVVPRIVPPRGRMPLTSLSVSSYDFSGQIRPSKPSGMPMTLHLYLRKAALTAARMTALSPGASPPPVQMPMQRMEDMRGEGYGYGCTVKLSRPEIPDAGCVSMTKNVTGVVGPDV